MGDLPAIIAAAAATLTPLGVGIGFVWNKVEKRMAAIEAKAEACEKREADSDAVIKRLTWEVRRDGRATRMLFMELHTLDPRNGTLAQVAEVLRQQYQPDLAIPEDWADLLAKIEAGAPPAPLREAL